MMLRRKQVSWQTDQSEPVTFLSVEHVLRLMFSLFTFKSGVTD